MLELTKPRIKFSFEEEIKQAIKDLEYALSFIDKDKTSIEIQFDDGFFDRIEYYGIYNPNGKPTARFIKNR